MFKKIARTWKALYCAVKTYNAYRNLPIVGPVLGLRNAEFVFNCIMNGDLGE